jgi:2-polyprenyl-3-methyl-5-hydroxy-6-metoxy-1,4-benzoquinol methylase
VSFGQSASLFNQTRQSYTSEVIAEVAGILGAPSGPRLIDLGCGTGIATRQLAALGFNVVGTDVDADMIVEASSVGEAAGYCVMSADRLNFRDENFHGATYGFSAAISFAVVFNISMNRLAAGER